MFETGGRPGKLDRESQQNIRRKIRFEIGWDKMDIHCEIRSEWQKTLSRQYPNGIPLSVSTKISKSTVRRWATKLLDENAHNDIFIL